MDQINEQPNPQQDDQLADFVDQVIKGKMKISASNPTDDLSGLEETILRLNSAFPQNPLDDASVKQMHVRLKSRIRRDRLDLNPIVGEQLEVPQPRGKHVLHPKPV